MIRSLDEAKSFLQSCQDAGQTVVFTNGCFDILHVGHIQLLQEAKAFGDILVVGLNSDRSVSSIKGSERPINTEANRATLLDALSVVDLVLLFHEDTPVSLIKELQPEVHVKGGDYDAEALPEYPVIKEYGGRVEIIDLVPNQSSSRIIKQIQSL